MERGRRGTIEEQWGQIQRGGGGGGGGGLRLYSRSILTIHGIVESIFGEN